VRGHDKTPACRSQHVAYKFAQPFASCFFITHTPTSLLQKVFGTGYMFFSSPKVRTKVRMSNLFFQKLKHASQCPFCASHPENNPHRD
jgi:hypothetical protein